MNKTTYTKQDLDKMWLKGSLCGEAIITTKDHIYEGEVLCITDEFVAMEYFNVVKGEYREVDIPFGDIEKARFY